MIILKIGGGENINLEGIIIGIAKSDEQFIIVHGANILRDALAEERGTPVQKVTSIKGYESVLTDEIAMDNMMMAYAGLRNKRIVEKCHQFGVNAIGLSGIDGALIRGKRNRGIRVEENGKKKILRDFSGKAVKGNQELFSLLLNAGYTPVICPPVLDEKNVAINTQNDGIIAALSKQFQPDTIIDLFAERGLLAEKNDPNSLISKIEKEKLGEYLETVSGGMKRKIHGMNEALESGVHRIIFGDGRVEDPLAYALAGNGTIIQ